ncbi:MAG: hypothetical protein LIO56_03330 [Lachnospiraceae bacterium]|nr:hypothetical protein [Lachnospiraceae bacterium]
MENGEYTIEVSMEGGTGRASITSPTTLIVEDGSATAEIEWSSPNYDYMIVDGETYLPVNDEGNSVFEIPVSGFDEEMTVVADTTAMSVPHEITYTLVFDSSSMQETGGAGVSANETALTIVVAVVVVVVILLVYRNFRKKRI